MEPTHVKELSHGNDGPLHFGHLFRYVSAYEHNADTEAELKVQVFSALATAIATQEPVVLDQDGEFTFICWPSGHFTLMIPWRTYAFVDDAGQVIKPETDDVPPPAELPAG